VVSTESADRQLLLSEKIRNKEVCPFANLKVEIYDAAL
jgi:hypothetical protein